MPRRNGPWIAITVTALPPAAAPGAVFGDLAPDEWDIEYQAIGGNITLGATTVAPAVLWGYDPSSARWVVLEYAFQVTNRVVVDGRSARDKIAYASGGLSSLHVEYPGLAVAGTPAFVARTVRMETA